MSLALEQIVPLEVAVKNKAPAELTEQIEVAYPIEQVAVFYTCASTSMPNSTSRYASVVTLMLSQSITWIHVLL